MKWLRRLIELIETERTLVLLCLSIPVLMLLVAFVLAIALTAFGVPKIGTLRSAVAGFAYVYLTLGMVWLPAYLVGCGWFWWTTRDAEAQENLSKPLYRLPLIVAAFIWFPSLFFAPASLSQKAGLFPVLAIVAVIGGYLWVGSVRLMSKNWR